MSLGSRIEHLEVQKMLQGVNYPFFANLGTRFKTSWELCNWKAWKNILTLTRIHIQPKHKTQRWEWSKQKKLKFCESRHHRTRNITKIQRIKLGFLKFYAVLRRLESYYCILRWIKWIEGSFSLNLNGEHPLWKIRKSLGKTRKSLEKPGNLGFPGKFSSMKTTQILAQVLKQKLKLNSNKFNLKIIHASVTVHKTRTLKDEQLSICFYFPHQN
jgi:hypothetical protein